MTTEQAISVLTQLLNHKDLKILNKQEMIACDQALMTLSEKVKEVELLKKKVEEFEILTKK